MNITEAETKQKAEEHWKFLEKWLHMVFVDAWIHATKHANEKRRKRERKTS